MSCRRRHGPGTLKIAATADAVTAAFLKSFGRRNAPSVRLGKQCPFLCASALVSVACAEAALYEIAPQQTEPFIALVTSAVAADTCLIVGAAGGFPV